MGLICTQGAHHTWRKPTVKPEHSERGVESKPTIHESIVVADSLVTVTHCINGFELFDLLIHFSQCLKETFLHVLSVVLTPYCTGNFFYKEHHLCSKASNSFSFFQIDWEAVVKLSEDFNGADLRNVCTEAGRLSCLCLSIVSVNGVFL